MINLFKRKNDFGRKSEIRIWFKEHKKKLSCSKCGKGGINLEFHHRLPSEKKNTISELVRKGEQMERILDEIKKCDVVCTPCHRKIHSTKQ